MIEAGLTREEIEKLAALHMNEEQTGLVPREEYILPLRRIFLQDEYRKHTENVQTLMRSDPELAKKEQLICIQLSKEIISLR